MTFFSFFSIFFYMQIPNRTTLKKNGKKTEKPAKNPSEKPETPERKTWDRPRLST